MKNPNCAPLQAAAEYSGVCLSCVVRSKLKPNRGVSTVDVKLGKMFFEETGVSAPPHWCGP